MKGGEGGGRARENVQTSIIADWHHGRTAVAKIYPALVVHRRIDATQLLIKKNN